MSTGTLTETSAFFAERAAHVDSPDGDVRPGLEFLGARDLLGLGAGSDGGPGLVAAAELIEAVAGECLSSAFALWAHRMVLEYLARGRSGPLTGELAARLRTGELTGSTAMATALRDVAGIEPVPVRAEPTATGLRLSGPIPWASNLFPGAVVVLPVRTGEGRAVVVVRVGDPGVTVAPARPLLALNGTASSSALLSDVDVLGAAVLSTDLAGFVAAFRPTFLVLQTAFCAGLAARSLDEAERGLARADAELADDVAEHRRSADALRARLRDLARDTRAEPATAYIRLRLAAARLAVAASRLESTVRGGAGYLATSGTSRRLREAAFLPIQAPTEGHLRWELRHSA
ncbi:acyl-CoA dehydrogenase family protein [Amycolatopsis viridis]|uniref:Alkylation response protein AidB-like acyl-CoA dehydrogenase n=1 Tax=Amycolatopsis viridis TaxID=185678 RepID=A0ABX0SVK5_9PSEU|nr:acyl-CoA dehydrogenase family protein [Amycolatopsis viridis]NIH80963.1 alkylation response protein AidB-like acyl-CoA dehydrogenase [Amycolatopsis viridis]